MKRSVPATPFRVIGPPGESFSASSGSPEQMSTNMAAISDAAPAGMLRSSIEQTLLTYWPFAGI